VVYNFDWQVQRILYSQPVNFLVNLLAYLWVGLQYLAFFPEEFFPNNSATKKMLAPWRIATVLGINLKIALRLIELRQGMARIIDLDVEERIAASKKDQ